MGGSINFLYCSVNAGRLCLFRYLPRKQRSISESPIMITEFQLEKTLCLRWMECKKFWVRFKLDFLQIFACFLLFFCATKQASFAEKCTLGTELLFAWCSLWEEMQACPSQSCGRWIWIPSGLSAVAFPSDKMGLIYRVLDSTEPTKQTLMRRWPKPIQYRRKGQKLSRVAGVALDALYFVGQIGQISQTKGRELFESLNWIRHRSKAIISPYEHMNQHQNIHLLKSLSPGPL